VTGVVAFCVVIAGSVPARAAESLCDAAFQDCRTPLIDLIRKEVVRIDVSFWFMEDARYSAELIKRWQAGVPVRVMMDTEANATYPNNKPILDQLKSAGIPMREKTAGGILHRKFMLFGGQGQVEFSGANYSPDAFVPIEPYVNYVDEAIYITDDPVVVNSFMTIMDNMWTATSGYSNYANVTAPLARAYPTYPIDPEMNFPPDQNYATRAVGRYNAETQKIDVQMYRITDRRHSDAMLDAFTRRHIPVRLYTDVKEYRDVTRLWHAWNVDRMWQAGIPVKVPAHEGINHQKTVLLYGQGLTIFGSSNWTGASAASQAEHNYFTKKTWFFNWFVDQFERKWNNTNPSGAEESKPFVPLPPDQPVYHAVANGGVGVPTASQKLTWYGGPWAHIYDIYFGTDPTASTLLAADQPLGPSETTTQLQTFALPTLQPGTTYYWRIVSKTAALLTKAGPIWSFTTAGTPPPPPPPGEGATTVVIWASGATVHGRWQTLADATAAGGSALWNTNAGESRIVPALANPANYFESSFSAVSGTAYHLWVRFRAEGDSLSNDSIHAQFNDSVDAGGLATMRVGTSSSAELVLQDGTSDSAVHAWGWADNGWNALGPHIYFAASGTHTIRIQQREDGAIVDQIVLSPDTYLTSPPGARDNDSTILPAADGSGGTGGGTLPTPWTDADVGAVPFPGSASYSGGTFTASGSGADIWGTSDAFHFVYQQLSGDGSIQARVASLQQADVWSKAGVMIRETLDANAKNAFMAVSAARGVTLQWRAGAGAVSSNSSGSLSAAPRWLRLVRSGSTLTGLESADGATWTTVGTTTVAMASTVYVGLAVTSHSTTASTTAAIDAVEVDAGAESGGGGLPAPWANRDIGATTIAGSAQDTDGTFSVTASGADIWGTADAFHFVYQPFTGDGSIDARIVSVQKADNWSKAGVMIRETLDPGSVQAFMLVSAARGVAMQWRPTENGSSFNAAGSTATAPRWVRLTRSGTTISGFESVDGVTWIPVSTQTIPMAATVYVGLAAVSHSSTASTTAVIDQVAVP
jgi:regulation of enolase protein 1 (concanavalin A-like superfamily)